MPNVRKLLTTIAIPVIGGSAVGFFATRSAKKKYQKLETPEFSQPGWVFPVVWTALYTAMGIAKYEFDRKPKSNSLQKQGDIAYNTQLGLNFLWSFLFFRWNLRGTALVEATMLWSAVTISTFYFYRESKLAGSLMVPYVIWTSFALVLNYKTWEMNEK